MVLAPFAASIVATIGVGSKPCGSAAAGPYLYQADYGGGTLSKIDPRTNRVVKTSRVGLAPCGVVFGGGSLWVEDYFDDTIVQVAPGSMHVRRKIAVGNSPWDVAYGFGAVWSSNWKDGTARASTRRRGRWCGRSGRGTPACIRTGYGSVWVGSQHVHGFTLVVRSAFGSLWAGDFQGSTLYRIAPAKR